MAKSQLKRLRAAVREQAPNKRQKRTTSLATNQDKGQQLRAEKLLPEIQRRHKVGGIIDRRIGENDPRLDPEQRMLQRYAAESQRSKRASIFNLEDAEDDLLTHGGRPLSGLEADDPKKFDDYEESDSGGVDGSDHEDENLRDDKEKRRKDLKEKIEEMQNNEPDRKKSKKEVMEEVIAKSKLHKYERQKAKEDDEDIREELDKGLPDLLAALRGQPSKDIQSNGIPKSDVAKEYDERVRQMAQDRRAQPTLRTKTEEEKVTEEAERLKELEEARLRRMKGEELEDDDGSADGDDVDHRAEEQEDAGADEAAEFGFKALTNKSKKQYMDVEAEDDFEIDDNLVASGSDVDIDLDDGSDLEPEAAGGEDDDFLRDVLPNGSKAEKSQSASNGELAYTYSCPQSLDDAFKLFKEIPASDVPTVIQRIRALYHPQLHKDNKHKISKFAEVLVEFISAQATTLNLPLAVVESIIRHVHSLSRNYGDSVARAFRERLLKMNESGGIKEQDLITLSAIGSIYPTSDHFHQVVTPAMTIMARWLCLTTPDTNEVSLKGAYLVALSIKYSSFAKRYIPEAVRFTLAALESQAPQTTIQSHANNMAAMMDLWADKSASIEIFEKAVPVLKKAGEKKVAQKLRILLDQAQHRRRALELHHHRPLPIKMSIPKFEESFNPDKHYDPDKARSEANKLRKEYKREQKGAMRELRKDSEFMSRERLREKKERDAAYEAKQRRLIAEIQGEEGREANAYEREKRWRKGKK